MAGLIIETCTERPVVIFTRVKKELQAVKLPFGYQSSKLLIPTVQELVKDFSQLEWIAVGAGPGSYTGIRVGVAAAKALAYSLNVPLIALSGLEGLIPEKEGTFASVLDARSGGVYLYQGMKSQGDVLRVGNPRRMAIPEAVELLGPIPVIVTARAERLRERLEEYPPNHRWEFVECYPEADYLARRSWELFEAGQFSMDGQVEIHYLRESTS